MNWGELLDYQSDASNVSFTSDVSMSARSSVFYNSFDSSVNSSTVFERGSSTDDMSHSDRSRIPGQIFDPAMMRSLSQQEDIHSEMMKHSKPPIAQKKDKAVRQQISQMTRSLNQAKDRCYEEKVKCKKMDK